MGNVAGEMCVISGAMALACCLGDSGGGECPPRGSAGSACVDGEVGKEEVPFPAGQGSHIREWSQEQSVLEPLSGLTVMTHTATGPSGLIHSPNLY